MGKKIDNFADGLCHLCMRNKKTLIDLSTTDDDGMLLSSKLDALSGVKMSAKVTCKCCRRRLKESYEFRKMCIETNEILNNDKSKLEVRELDNENYLSDALYFLEVDEDTHREFSIKCEFETGDYLCYEEDIPEALEVVEEKMVDLPFISQDTEIKSVEVDPLEIPEIKTENEESVNVNDSKDNLEQETQNTVNEKNDENMNESVNEDVVSTENNSNIPIEQHTCKFCNKAFTSPLRLRLHIKRVHRQIYLLDCKIGCPVCSMKFKHTKDLKLHMMSHNKDSYFACNFCDKKFYSKISWRKHIKVHATEHNEICKICNKTILSNISFIYHTQWHRMRKALSDETYYSCETCDLHFSEFEELEKHFIEKHSGTSLTQDESKFENNSEATLAEDESKSEKNSEATLADDESKSEKHPEAPVLDDELKSEKANKIETDSKKEAGEETSKQNDANTSVTFRCNLCNRYFKSLQNVKPHITDCFTKMDRPKVHMCDICGKRFTSAWSMTNHKRGHSDVKAYICDICGQPFKWHNDLTNHRNRIHNHFRPYVCKLCGKRCGTSATLKSHMRLHTGEKPYRCHICKVAFSQNSSLKEHMFKHADKNEEVCPVCNKVFRTPLRLKTHMKRHNLYRKRYPCDLCGRQFTEKNSVRKHKYKIHQQLS